MSTTLRKELEMWKQRALIAEAKVATLRSSRWPTVRMKHLKLESTCCACGGKDHLEVHHISPFHVDPSLELVESNLITLCESGGNCHLTFGHLGSWKNFNPTVRADAAKELQRKALSMATAGGKNA